MMPPIQKHVPEHPSAHLRKTVRAHKAIREGISSHAQRQEIARIENLRKMEQAQTALVPISPDHA